MRWIVLLALVSGCAEQSWRFVAPAHIDADKRELVFVLTPGDAMLLRVTSTDAVAIHGDVVQRWVLPERPGATEPPVIPEGVRPDVVAERLGWLPRSVTIPQADVPLRNVQIAERRRSSHALATTGAYIVGVTSTFALLLLYALGSID